MDNCQLSLFSEREWTNMISPSFSRKKNRIEWELRKSRLGAVRADLSNNLQLSEEGCPIIKPYWGVGQIVQKRGGNVIPTVGWSFRRSFDYCFCGLSEGGTVAISTNGVLCKFVSLRMFMEGVFELERQLHPEVICIYGNKIELKTKARQIWFPNIRLTHLRKLGKKLIV